MGEVKKVQGALRNVWKEGSLFGRAKIGMLEGVWKQGIIQENV